uniref:Uncharacterized protein n=1 Tax=Arundo donax TaxID=35708 RepID=A0A0A9C720_ARUDO
MNSNKLGYAVHKQNLFSFQERTKHLANNLREILNP